MTVGDTDTLPPALMAPTALLIDPDNPENDARNCVLLPLLIVVPSVVKEVIAAGPGTVVVVVGATVVVVGAVVVVVVDVVVVEVEVVVVVGTAVAVVVLVATGATVVADVGALGVVVVVGTTDVEIIVSGATTVVVLGVRASVVVLVGVALEVVELGVAVVVLIEVVVPDQIGKAVTRGGFIAALISAETKIDVCINPFGHFAVDLQRICLVVDLVQIGRTPFGAIFDALVVLDKHLPVRENCNALLVVMQTVLAVLVVHEIFDSDFPHAPVLEMLKIT
ncbi:MAG: hypothetical protein RIS46_606 [Actinomycetota bacterium]